MTTVLADHLWQSTVFAAAMALLAALFRNSAARVRYGIWLAASVKFLVPFAALVAAGASIPWRAAPEAPSPMMVIAQTLVSPFAEDVPLAPAAAPAVPADANWWLAMAATLWLLGVAIVLIRWSAAWTRMRRLARHGTPVVEGRVAALLGTLRLPARRRLPLRVTEAAIEPGVFGIWRPVLLWPRQIELRLSDTQIAGILAHELAHVQRRDNLTAAVHMAVRALFWFHPMVWWIDARLMDERERACDEAVVFGGGQREAYAEGLLKACEFCVESRLPCAAGVAGGDLKRRVTAIMRTVERPAVSRAAAVVLWCAAVGTVAGPLAVGLMAAPPRLLPPQIAVGTADDPSFEVASVKLAGDQNGPRTIVFQPGGRFVTENISTRTLIAAAFGGRVPLQEFRIKGGPSWITSERYTINAHAGGDPAPEYGGPPPAMFGMVRSLLRDRFELQVHLETEEAEIYRLVRARRGGALGPGLKPSDAGCSTIRPAAPPLPLAPGTLPRCGGRIGPGTLTFNGVRIGDLAARDLTRAVGAVVVDQTGITGDFDVTLEWTPDRRNPDTGARTNDPGVSIFTAVQEQLGLTLEPSRGAVDVLVIDRIERPTPD